MHKKTNFQYFFLQYANFFLFVLFTGKTYERIALEKFQEEKGFDVSPAGLFIHPDMSFLAASPDGCLYRDRKRILCEVKCPYNGRNDKILPGMKFQFLEENNGVIQLKKNHNYYYQVIGQMAITKSKLCYFIVYTYADFFIQEIEFDSDFFELNVFPKLNHFYQHHYKPYIAKQM